MDLPLVLVEWDDAWVDEDPVTMDNVAAKHTPTVIHTLGWVMLDDAVGITLVNEYYDENYRGRTFIPRGMVKSVTPYKLVKPRKKKEKEH